MTEERFTAEQLRIQNFAYKIAVFIGFEDSESPEFEQDYQEVVEMLRCWILELAADDPEILRRVGL